MAPTDKAAFETGAADIVCPDKLWRSSGTTQRGTHLRIYLKRVVSELSYNLPLDLTLTEDKFIILKIKPGSFLSPECAFARESEQ